MKPCRILVVCLVMLGILAGCRHSSPYTRESRPRANQQRWLDEREVISTVVACVQLSRYASRHSQAIREYALLIRRVYGNASVGGMDVDAGLRALNYVKKVHKDAKGSRDLWDEALRMAQTKEDISSGHRMPGFEPPPDYR